MSDLFNILKTIFPLGMAVPMVLFIYFLIAFKRLADEFIKIENGRANSAREQAQYLKEQAESTKQQAELHSKFINSQLEAVEKKTTAYSKMYQDQEIAIKRRDEERARVESELKEVKQKLEEEKNAKILAIEQRFSNLSEMVEQLKQKQGAGEEIGPYIVEVQKEVRIAREGLKQQVNEEKLDKEKLAAKVLEEEVSSWGAAIIEWGPKVLSVFSLAPLLLPMLNSSEEDLGTEASGNMNKPVSEPVKKQNE